MRALSTVVLALAVAIALTSVAAADPTATKQRVQIDLKSSPDHGFALAPLEVGALERDSGTHRCTGEVSTVDAVRGGQSIYVTGCRAMVLAGKLGTLVLRYQYAWVEAGSGYNIATGTWKVRRGTGQYARVTGSGRSAEVGSSRLRSGRFQGYLTSP